MWLFVLLILFGAYLQTIIKLSIVNRAFRWVSVLLFTLPVLFMYSQAARINLKDFNFLMSNLNTLSTICVLVIVQEALVLIFGSILLRRYYLGKKLHFWYYAVLLPSGLFPVICFVGIVYLFNTCSGMSFQGIAFWFLFVIFIVTGGIAELLCRLTKDKEQLMQWLALTSLTQIFIAMFLPVIFGGKSPGGDLVKFDINMLTGVAFILVTTAIFTVLAHLGMWQKLAIIKKRLLCLN
jgi:hypothetical protein